MEESRIIDIVFNDRAEAERILTKLTDMQQIYGVIRLSEYYEAAGLISAISAQTDEYVWDDLSKADIIPFKNGYKIRFPRPKPLPSECPCSETPASTSDDPFKSIKQDIKKNIDKFMCKLKDDPVNHPQHYQSKNGLEVIDVIEAFTDDLTGMEAVCTGNALKYICRWKHKNGVQDLKKAVWYMNHLIDILEKENSNEQ